MIASGHGSEHCRQFIQHAVLGERAATDDREKRSFQLQGAAFLECFLLHFRNLMEFLQHQRGDRKVHWAGEFTRSKWSPAEAKVIWSRLNRPTEDSQPLMTRRYREIPALIVVVE